MSVLGSARVLFTAETADAHRGIAEVQRAYQGATRNIAGNLERQNSATLRVTLAQRRYQDAIRRSGAESNQAVSALIRLRDAEERVARSTVEAGVAAGRSGAGFRRFGEDAERGARGALAGSRILRGARSALVFGSSAFVGFYGVTAAVRKTVDAAREQEQVQAALRQTLRQTGISYGQNREEIERTIQAQSRMSAFDDEQLTRSFTSLIRRTRDVNEALRLNAVAADVARGRHIDLQAAVTLVTRASLGQVGSLRRLGLDVRAVTAAQDALRASGEKVTIGARRQAQEQDRVATSQRVIAALQRSYGGQAAAYSRTAAGAQDRFNKTLNDTEEIIGRAVTPQMTRLFNSLGQYLQRINSTGELQRNVATAMRDTGQVAHGLADTFQLLRTVLGPLNVTLGGTRNTVKLVAEVFVGLKLLKWAREFGLVRTSVREAGAAAAVSAGEFDTLATSEARAAEVNAGGAATGVAKTGAAAANAEKKVGRLRGSLLGLNQLTIAAITIPIVYNISTRVLKATGGYNLLERLGAAYYGSTHLSVPGGPTSREAVRRITAVARRMYQRGMTPGQVQAALIRQFPGMEAAEAAAYARVAATEASGARNAAPPSEQNPRADVPGSPAYQPPGSGDTTDTPPARPVPRTSRRQRIEAEVARASLGVSRGEQGAQQRLAAALRRQVDQDRRDEELQRRLARTDVKNRKQHLQELQALYGDEQGALDQIAGIEQQNAQKTAEARRKAQAARDKAARERQRAAAAAERQQLRLEREQQRERQAAERQHFGQVTDILRGFTARATRQRGRGQLDADRATLRLEERDLERFIRDNTLSLEHRRQLRGRLDQVRQRIDDISRQIREATVRAAEARARAAAARAQRPGLLIARAEARAALTETTDDDLRAYRAEENLIRRRLAALARVKRLSNQQLQSQTDLLTQQKSVRDKINELASQSKAAPGQGQAFLRELSGELGQFASNIAPRTGAVPAGSRPVTIEQHFHAPVSSFAAQRAAREAAMHYPVG